MSTPDEVQKVVVAQTTAKTRNGEMEIVVKKNASGDIVSPAYYIEIECVNDDMDTAYQLAKSLAKELNALVSASLDENKG